MKLGKKKSQALAIELRQNLEISHSFNHKLETETDEKKIIELTKIRDKYIASYSGIIATMKIIDIDYSVKYSYIDERLVATIKIGEVTEIALL